MEREMRHSDALDLYEVDLYEELLYARAAKGIRPLLYVSSHNDLECSVLMLLDEAPDARLAGHQRSRASGIRYHVMTH